MLAVAAMVAGLAGMAFGQHDHGKPGPATVTVEGRLIDLGCYTMGMKGGDKHVKCATACLEKGIPVGLIDAKGEKVYTVVLPAPKMAAFVEKTVRITGALHAGSLLAPEKMELRDGDAWKAVELPAAM
jgi:hypothetical protein